jgi:hypothetical protein
MTSAKFLLRLLIVIVAVVVLALIVVWGLNLGLKRLVTDDKTFTPADREALLQTLGSASTSFFVTDAVTGEPKLTSVGEKMFKTLGSTTTHQLSEAERQAVLDSLSQQKLIN